jgi:hypothetical protein
LRFFESMVEFNGAERRANQERLRELVRAAAGDVTLICSHDSSDFFVMKSAQREAEAKSQPVSAPQPVKPPRSIPQRDLRARR